VITFELNPSVFGITAICAELSEVSCMADHSRWLNSYDSAMHAFGNKNCQEHKTNIAICPCIERPWQIDLEETTEREEIYTALADLSTLKILDRKYA
jgi:hypothetical protein